MTGRIDVLHGTVMLLFIVGYIAFTFREDSKVNSASTHSDCDKTEKVRFEAPCRRLVFLALS